jgi:long-chain acyl-CoA synthetase
MLRCDGKSPRGRLAWKYALARRLLFAPIRRAVGLSRARVLISGAAPLSAEVLRDLASLDLPVRELYGQTEDCGPTTNNRPGETRWGSVGRPFRGCDVRIAEDSEILVRGANFFAGYYKEPEATAAVLKDGWLHSGDLGHFDQDGYLYITGRKKEILITAGGKNVAPRNLEEALKRSPLIEEAVVLGDRQKFLAALVTLRMGVTRTSLRIPESADPDPGTWPGLADALWEHVQAVNREFSQVEQIKRIAVLRASLSVDAGELTPTLKLRRSVISERHRDLIGRLYAADSPDVVFE